MPLEFKPNLEKIAELLLHLAYVRPNSDKYQAVKFFYLADREHIARHGRPITYEQYFALPYGPVASNAMDLLNRNPWVMRAANLTDLPFVTEVVSYRDKGKDKEITYIREPLRKVQTELFSKSNLRIFNEIIEKYGSKSFEELFELTHKHFAYRRAWRNKAVGAKSSPMLYEDMIEDPVLKEKILEDISPVASKLA